MALASTRLALATLLVGGVVHAQDPPRASSMTLAEAYRLALRQSEQVQIAVGNRDVAETNYTDALTIMGPTLNVASTARYQNIAQGVTSPGQPSTGVQSPYSWTTQGTLSQPIFRRQIFDGRLSAKIAIASNEAQLKRVRQQLMFDVATAFINVLSDRQQVTLARAALKRADEQQANAARLIKIGRVLPGPGLLAEIEVNRAQVSVNAAEGVLRLQESTFARLTGQLPPANLGLPPTPPHDVPDEALASSVHERADLRSLHLLTEQARAQTRFLQAKILWPTLDMSLYAGFVVSSTAQGHPPDYRYPTYGMSGVLNFPIFQSGDEWLQVKLQRQRVGIAAYQEAFLRRQISDDVRQAVAAIGTAANGVEIATRQRKTAQTYFDLISKQFDIAAPGVSFLDVATAQGALFEADTNYALASYQLELATYQLLFAEGKIDL